MLSETIHLVKKYGKCPYVFYVFLCFLCVIFSVLIGRRIEKKTFFRYTFLYRSPLGGRTVNRKGKDMAKKKMPKKTAAGKATAKTASRKTAVKKTARKTAGMKEGSKYTCGVCGLAVTVDTACGCAETTHLICCEKPMRMKR